MRSVTPDGLIAVPPGAVLQDVVNFRTVRAFHEFHITIKAFHPYLNRTDLVALHQDLALRKYEISIPELPSLLQIQRVPA